MSDMSESPQPEPSARRKASRWSALLGVVALFGSGVGIGYLFTSAPVPATTTTSVTVSDVTFTTDPVQPPATAGDPSTFDTDEPIADVAEALLPSIVQIQVRGVAGSIGGGVGSGVIYDANGYVLTAAHVVEGAVSVEVRLYDGTVLDAEVIGTDTTNDIAVVEVDLGTTDRSLVAAPLALGDRPRVGQVAIALGSPWGLDSTVTSGIVSAVDRSLDSPIGGVPRSMLQTDAAINPGNSGGPLADRNGRVIGINVSIFTESGASDGVGFAVPIDRAYRVAEAIRSGGEFVPGFLGVRGDNAPTGSAAGAVIVEVTPGSGAEAAGLEVDDLVTAVDGLPVTGIVDLAARIRDREAGDVVTLTVERDGETLTLEAMLTANPS